MTTQLFKKGARGILAMIVLLVTCTVARAQDDNPTLSVYVANDVLVSPTVYEFDLMIKAEAPTTNFNLRTVQICIGMNPSFRNSGTLTRASVAGSNGLSTAIALTYNNGSTDPNYINITGAAVACPGNNITQTAVRITRVRLTNTVAFGCVNPDLRFNYRQSTVGGLKLRTDISN